MFDILRNRNEKMYENISLSLVSIIGMNNRYIVIYYMYVQLVHTLSTLVLFYYYEFNLRTVFYLKIA